MDSTDTTQCNQAMDNSQMVKETTTVLVFDITAILLFIYQHKDIKTEYPLKFPSTVLTPIIQMPVNRITNYPDQLGLSGTLLRILQNQYALKLPVIRLSIVL
jgi:hypothetical protein